MSSYDDIHIMAQVITMYYIDNLSQQEIADQLFYSRSKISRILQRSKDLKIVEVNIRYPVERDTALEEKLLHKYKLTDAVVIKRYSDDYPLMLKRLCAFAAEYVDTRLTDGMTLGLSWGTTVYNMVKAAEPQKPKRINVVQVVGAVSDGLEKDYDPIELIRNMAVKYNGTFQPLYAPLYVENEVVSSSLKKSPLISNAMEKGRNADMLLTGISYFNEKSNVTWEKYITPEEKQQLLAQGAVGIYFAHFIDKGGRIVSHDVDNRVIGIPLEDVRRNNSVITVAAGPKKATALKAALHGNYVNVLIVDDSLAESVLGI